MTVGAIAGFLVVHAAPTRLGWEIRKWHTSDDHEVFEAESIILPTGTAPDDTLNICDFIRWPKTYMNNKALGELGG